MKSLNRIFSIALIGIITGSAGLCLECGTTAAADRNPHFKAPREIIAYLCTNAAKLPPAQIDQGLWELERLWGESQKNYLRQLNSPKMQTKLAKYRFTDLAQFRNIQDPAIMILLTNIMADSMRLTHSHRQYNLKINYQQVNSTVTRYASPPVAAYFRIVNRNQNIAATGALKITPDELARRISETDLFLQNNPGFTKKETVVAIYRKGLAVYLQGTDQTPAFTANKVNARFLKSYRATATKYQNTPFGAIITEYLAVLKQNNYRKTKPVLDFIRAKTASESTLD